MTEPIDKIKIKNYISYPLSIFDKKEGVLIFYNLNDVDKNDPSSTWYLKNLISLISYRLFLMKNGNTVLKKKNKVQVIDRYRGA